MKITDYRELIEKCSYCAFCQETCPVFLEDLIETHLARARVNLINEVLLKNTMPVTSRFREIIDRCLLCTNCTQTCPSGVPVDEIIAAARFELDRQKRAGSIKKRILRTLLMKRGLTGFLSKAGSLAQRAGKLVGLKVKELPPLAEQPLDQKYTGIIPAEGNTRARVAYFIGCATNYLYPDTGEAAIQVLTRNGFEVVIPQGQVCCGIPVMAEGDETTVREMIRHNVSLFDGIDVEAIITDCTSCAMMLRTKMPKLIDDSLRERAQTVAEKVWEVTDFLVDRGLVDESAALQVQCTYHVPCHRGWKETVADAPRTLLSRIPGVTLVEMENPEACCGAGGTFFTEYRDLSRSICSRKIQDIKNTGTGTVITQCPACRFYLSLHLDDYRVIHPVSLLARAHGGDEK
jgi:glycolate oxidase iron-sulfur subunit